MLSQLAALKAKRIYLGTSSWKYEGWKGILYHRNYPSQKAFNDQCLEEYAEHYPAVGVDHTYYAWPLLSTMKRYAEQTPADFKFAFKVTEDITVLRFPKLKRYGKKSGTDNPSFLDPESFKTGFLGPLSVLGDRVGPLMLEFSQFHPGMIESGAEFVARLDRFLAVASQEGFPLSVEIRNANWLKPAYFETLARHKAGHVFNSWTKMPTIEDQIEAGKTFAPPFYVSRLLLAPGTKYAEAVEVFSPYDTLMEEHPSIRDGARRLIKQAITASVPAFVFVNNRAEGCAPKTIEAIVDGI